MNVENILESKRFTSNTDFRESDVIHQWKVDWGLYQQNNTESFPREIWIDLPDYAEFDYGEMKIAVEDIPKLIEFLKGQYELQTD